MFTAQHLLTPPTKSNDPLQAPQLSGEALMKELIDRPVACAVRIGKSLRTMTAVFSSNESLYIADGQFLSETPTSAYVALFCPASTPLTSQHLRDGFTRAIAARQKLARASGDLTDADDEVQMRIKRYMLTRSVSPSPRKR